MKKPIKLKTFLFISSLIFLLLGANRLNAQCAANFNYTLGASGSATFVSNSTGTTAGTTYFWSVGNSSYANWGPNLTHTYTDNQTYSVTLTITDTTASPTCSSSITKTVGVTSAPCFSSVTIYTFLTA